MSRLLMSWRVCGLSTSLTVTVPAQRNGVGSFLIVDLRICLVIQSLLKGSQGSVGEALFEWMGSRTPSDWDWVRSTLLEHAGLQCEGLFRVRLGFICWLRYVKVLFRASLRFRQGWFRVYLGGLWFTHACFKVYFLYCRVVGWGGWWNFHAERRKVGGWMVT
jgi:hypothetical protein